MTVATFSGTVVDCRTRFKITKPLSGFLTHFDANWVLTIRIESADAGVPVTVGEDTHLLIHSPAQVLHDSVEDCIGKRFTLAIDIDDAGKARWHSLRRA